MIAVGTPEGQIFKLIPVEREGGLRIEGGREGRRED